MTERDPDVRELKGIESEGSPSRLDRKLHEHEPVNELIG
jgi:hypothetical protein